MNLPKLFWVIVLVSHPPNKRLHQWMEMVH